MAPEKAAKELKGILAKFAQDHPSSGAADACAICSALKVRDGEMVYGSGTDDMLTPEAKKLQYVVIHEAHNLWICRCPQCGQFYLYSQSGFGYSGSPSDSADEIVPGHEYVSSGTLENVAERFVEDTEWRPTQKFSKRGKQRWWVTG